MVGVGDCGDDVRNVGRCQRAYLGITGFLHPFWFRKVLLFGTFLFVPTTGFWLLTGGSFRGALADLFGGSVFFTDLFGGGVFLVLERGDIMFAIMHSPLL